jgi:hypothetical protein
MKAAASFLLRKQGGEEGGREGGREAERRKWFAPPSASLHTRVRREGGRGCGCVGGGAGDMK